MWIEILSIIIVVIAAILIGRERDKHTRRDGPGELEIQVKESDT
jgi:hypothetical protein